MQRVPELRHTHTVQIKDQAYRNRAFFPLCRLPKLGDRGHDRKIGVLKIWQRGQVIRDRVPLCPTVPLDLQAIPFSPPLLPFVLSGEW